MNSKVFLKRYKPTKGVKVHKALMELKSKRQASNEIDIIDVLIWCWCLL